MRNCNEVLVIYQAVASIFISSQLCCSWETSGSWAHDRPLLFFRVPVQALRVVNSKLVLKIEMSLVQLSNCNISYITMNLSDISYDVLEL